MVINPKVLAIIEENKLNHAEVYLFFMIFSFVKYDERILEILSTPLKDGRYVLNLDNEEKYRILFMKGTGDSLEFKYPLLIDPKQVYNSYEEFCKKLDATKSFGTNGHLNNMVPYRVYSKNAELKESVEKLQKVDLDKAVEVILNYYLRTPQPPGLAKFLRENFMTEYELTI
jgi:hypothetical protein